MVKRQATHLGGYVAAAILGCAFSGLIAPRSTTFQLTSPAFGGEAVVAADLENASDTLELAGLQRKFEAVSRKVAGSVVSISASCSVVDTSDSLRTQSLNHEKLEGILERTTRMVGTGFIIDPRVTILTNEHVVGEGESIWITTDDRKVYRRW